MLVCLCMVACLGASLPPLPPKPKLPHASAAVHQGAGAAALISKLAVIVPPSPTTNAIAWQYPPGLVASNLWWNIEASTDLAHWSVLVSNASGVCEVRVLRTEPARVYRLCGRMYP